MIRVGFLTGKEPFCFLLDGKPKGIAFDIWNQFRENYEIVETSDDPEYLLQKLEENQLDVLVGSFSMSHDRMSMFEFSKPFYISQLKIFQFEPQINWVHFTIMVFAIFIIISILLAIINKKPIVTSGFEFLENFMSRSNIIDKPGFIPKVVNTLVKILSFTFTLITISVITYLITMYKMTNQIELKSIFNERVGHIKSKYFEKLLFDRNLISVPYSTTEELRNAFLQKKVNYILEDDFVFTNMFKKEFRQSDILKLDEYGFVFKDNDLCKEFNLFLFKLQENQNTLSICDRYLNEKDLIYCLI